MGRIALAAALSLGIACASQSPEQKLADDARPAISWVATLGMTGERWIANSVPKSFVQSTVAEARKDLGQTVDDAAKSKARADARIPLQRMLHEARAAGSGLEKAADAGDRTGAARQVELLKGLQVQLDQWQRQTGGPQ
jgi:hypothetical protein